MRIASTAISGTGYTGKMYSAIPSATSFTEMGLPAGVEGIDFKPGRVKAPDRSLYVGQWSRPMTRGRDNQLHAAGLIAPGSAPTMTAGSGAILGNCICRLVFSVKIGNKVLQRSNPGPAATTLSLSSEGRVWSDIPTTAADARTTHVEGYVSVDGFISFRAWERPLGVSTVTENTPTTTLASRTHLPVKLVSGRTRDDTMARGVPPYIAVAVWWHNRMWFITPSRPGVGYSKLNEPESVNPTSFIPTKGGEYPVALGILDNELVAFCARKAYGVQGFGISDFRLDTVSESYGCISHWGIKVIQGVLIFPSAKGISAYFGGGNFRNLMTKSRRADWVAQYALFESEYERAEAADNDSKGEYVLAVNLPSSETNRSSIWKGFYPAVLEDGEREPYWSNDIMKRQTTSLGVFFPEGSKRSVLVYGACDGYVRQADATDGDDDGDTYAKGYRLKHPHLFMGDQAGHDAHGRAYPDFDWFGKHGGVAATVNLYAGDDSAAEMTTAPFSKSIAVPPTTIAGRTATAKTSHHLPTPGVGGKGVTVEVTGTSPVGMEHRGFAITHREGSQSRQRA
jgi:hypothetical protein